MSEVLEAPKIEEIAPAIISFEQIYYGGGRIVFTPQATSAELKEKDLPNGQKELTEKLNT